MPYTLELPDIGEGVVEAEIMKWFVTEGDEVAEDQPLVEVMTDKATVTIPAPKRGRVTRLLWKEGDVAKVHHALVELELEGSGQEVVRGLTAVAKAARCRRSELGPNPTRTEMPHDPAGRKSPSRSRCARTSGGLFRSASPG